jgi:hypothetical protein
MDEAKFFTIEATARFFQVPESKICEWLKRTELVAKLRNHQLVIGADEIARMISIYPERQPAGAALGVQRQKMQRISTSESRGRVPAKEI